MGNRGNVPNEGNIKPARLKSPNGGLSSWSRTFDVYLEVLKAIGLRFLGDILGRLLSGIRGAFA